MTRRLMLKMTGFLGSVGLILGQASQAAPKYGPAGAPRATPLALDASYFKSATHPAPDFWALTGYYVPQFNGAACSVASVTMVLNAARAPLKKDSEQKLILQQELLEQVDAEWKKRVNPGLGQALGLKRGVTLDLLARFAEDAFKKNGFPHAHAKVWRLDPKDPASLRKLRELLDQNEKSASDFLISNFDQKVFTDDSAAGHVAPIAAYDAASKRVLILDPDREWYEPYWVSDQLLLEAMGTVDLETRKTRGLVRVSLE